MWIIWSLSVSSGNHIFRTHFSVRGSYIIRQELHNFHKNRSLVSAFACPYPMPHEQISPHSYTIFQIHSQYSHRTHSHSWRPSPKLFCGNLQHFKASLYEIFFNQNRPSITTKCVSIKKKCYLIKWSNIQALRQVWLEIQHKVQFAEAISLFMRSFTVRWNQPNT